MIRSATFMMLSAVVLAACAGATPQEGVQSADLAKKDSACFRECTSTYSSCIQRAGNTQNRLVANDILRACGGALKMCSDTCPAAK